MRLHLDQAIYGQSEVCHFCHICPPFTRKRIVSLFWTVSPHSLGSCYFRGVWTTCLPHKGGGPVECLAQGHKKRACWLVLHNLPMIAKRQAGKLWIPFFKVFWYDSTREINPRPTDCDVDAQTTAPSHWMTIYVIYEGLQ